MEGPFFSLPVHGAHMAVAIAPRRSGSSNGSSAGSLAISTGTPSPSPVVHKIKPRYSGFAGRYREEELVGVVARILQEWDDVRLIRLEDGTICKVPDPGKELDLGHTYRFHGLWKNHHTYGRQFHATSFAGDAPITKRGVVLYLADVCDNIGNAKALKVWDKFGDKSVAVVRDEPEKIAEAGILTLEEAIEASKCLQHEGATQQAKIDLLGLFKGYGLGERAIQAALMRWGARAGEVIRRDPFKLMVEGVPGAGYLRCDRIYQELGLPLNRLKRQMLKAWYDLHSDSSGHTWFSYDRCTRGVSARAIELGIRAKWFVTKVEGKTKWITERTKAVAESALSFNLVRLASWRPMIGDQHRTNWPAIEMIEGVSDHQRGEISKSLSSPVAVLAGCPGTGKTFSAAAIIKAIKKRGGALINVCAPTGKAAVRVSESLAKAGVTVEAKTIHALLRIVPGMDQEDDFSNTGQLEGFVIVDETSMVDVPLMAKLLAACRTGTHILFLGDPYQLPPVGHGAPLRDMLKCGLVSTGELSEIQRNAGDIVKACKAIKEGGTFETSDRDIRFDRSLGNNLRLIESQDHQDTLAGVLKLHDVVPQHRFHPVWDVQVLVAVNTRGACSRVALNKLLQQKLNPNGYTIPSHPFRVDDKIICLKNNKAKLVGLKHDRHDMGPAQQAKSWADKPNIVDGETVGEAYVANGEIGKVLAVGINQTIAQFEGPLRTIRILHGSEKDAAKDNAKGKEDREAAANPANTPDGEAESEEKEESSSAVFYDLGFAITTHKCQGSEAPCVIVVIDPLARVICTREHLYTSISRAKELCLLVGQRRVADEFCRKVALGRRKTFLVELLRQQKAEDNQAITAPVSLVHG